MANSTDSVSERNKEGPPKFDISAAVIRQLGEELVSDEVTAIVELAKNAWDADSDWISIEVNTVGTVEESTGSAFSGTKGYICLRDGGDGMSYSDIERGWLTVSASSKRNMKRLGKVTKKGRTPLGDKGLGRLSTQRLGRNLDLFTKKENGSGHHVSFSWTDFSDGSRLSEVPVSHREISTIPKGTTLIISNLRDSRVWQGKAKEELAARLSQLIYPFKSGRNFRVSLTINDTLIDLASLAEQAADTAPCKYELEFDGNLLRLKGKFGLIKLRGNKPEEYERYCEPDLGKDFFDFWADSSWKISNAKYAPSKGGFIDFEYWIDLSKLDPYHDEKNTKNETAPSIASPGPFDGKIYEFVLKGDDDQAGGFSSLSDLKNYVKANYGIKIYRDGFGVRPYGLDDNDWLKLGGGVTSGGSWYGLRPKNVIGYINISEKSNSALKEKTDREGFVRNPHSENFFKLMREAIGRINEVSENIRRGLNDYYGTKKADKSTFKSEQDSFDALYETADQLNDLSTEAQAAKISIDDAVTSLSDAITTVKDTPLLANSGEHNAYPILVKANNALKDSQQLLRKVETLLTKARHIDDAVLLLEPKLEALRNQTQELMEMSALGLTAEALSHEFEGVAGRLSEQTKKASQQAAKHQISDIWLLTYLEEVSSAASAMRKQLSHLAPSLKFVREKKSDISAKELCLEVTAFFKQRLESKGISIATQAEGEDFLIVANKGRLLQVVDNLVINSEYWVQRKKHSTENCKPTIFVEFDAPFVRVWDNGDGVDPEIEDAVFQPFMSRKPVGEGRGLGLFISRQLLEPMGCELTLLHKRNSLNRRYVFQINLAGAKKSDE